MSTKSARVGARRITALHYPYLRSNIKGILVESGVIIWLTTVCGGLRLILGCVDYRFAVEERAPGLS